MRDAGAGRRTEVLENQHILDARVGLIEGLDAVPVHADQVDEVLLRHVLDGDAMLGVVDDYFVPAVAVNRLLQAEHQVGCGCVVAQYRVQIFDHAQFPVVRGRCNRHRGRCHVLVAGAEGAGFDVLAGVPGRRRFILARAHTARGGNQHRLAGYHGIDADFAHRFRFVAHAGRASYAA